MRPKDRPGNAPMRKSKPVVEPPNLIPSPPQTSYAKEEKKELMCAWFKCEKGENSKRASVRSNSKYCSRDCSNRNARWRHKHRKK
jgi:hypothetical protein